MVFNEIIIGIVGGGQLGKMMIQEGKKMGLKFIILDPAANCPAASIADGHIIGDFYDEAKLRELAKESSLITYEFEHIAAELLVKLADEGYSIYPSPLTLKLIQDKFLQKTFLKENNLPTPDFIAINSLQELYKAGMLLGYPFLLKLRRGGYDGKGNYLIRGEAEVLEAYEALGGDKSLLMAEAFVDFRLEISAIVARGRRGELEVYPLAENLHQDNILRTTIAPARVSEELAIKAKDIALRAMELLEGVGVFCIEMFVASDERILVNEIAPRTHNSGHYTMEGCYTSQFAQHLRCILGLPLGSTELIHPSVMINLLGEKGFSGKARLAGLAEALRIPKSYIHFYGKEEVKGLRKMGHINVIDETVEGAILKADQVRRLIRVIGDKGGEVNE